MASFHAYLSELREPECVLWVARQRYGDYISGVYLDENGGCVLQEDVSWIRTTEDMLHYLNTHRLYGPEITLFDVQTLIDAASEAEM